MALKEHKNRIGTIDAERAVVEKRSQAGNARWQKQKHKLQAALRRARDT